MVLNQAQRLLDVRYDLRGPLLRRARELEADGHEIIKLNLGNPGQFGLSGPPDVLADVVQHVTASQAYSDARGLLPAREAVVDYYQRNGVSGVNPGDVYLGNGVSELIAMALQALLDPGDEVLIPCPDYPLWTGTVRLCGARPVHYICDEKEGWAPDLEDADSKISDHTRAIVIINPNNPTGCVYSEETLQGLLDIARRHQLVVLSDEIYDQILYDGAKHIFAAALAPDLPVLTFGGLSKNYRLAGFRSGWLIVSGPVESGSTYRDGLELLANMRLCPNVIAQHAVPAALGSAGDLSDLLSPGGRLRDQRDFAWKMLTEMPGVHCVKPSGALYLFPRFDRGTYGVIDDERFVLSLLEEQHLMLSHGSGFNMPSSDHVRIVFLAPIPVLDEALSRLAKFLGSYEHQDSISMPEASSATPA